VSDTALEGHWYEIIDNDARWVLDGFGRKGPRKKMFEVNV